MMCLTKKEHWQDELHGIIEPGDTPIGAVGLPYLMVEVLGQERAYALFEGGYLFTSAWPAILVATMPYGFAFVVQFVAGMLLFVILYYFYYSVSYRHTVRALIALTVVFPFITMLSSGYLANFFTVGMAVKLVTLIVLELGLHARTVLFEQAHSSEAEAV